MLPLEIQMQIDLTAQRHHAEVAEGFAKARRSLLPDQSNLAKLQALLLGNNAAAQMQEWRYQNALSPSNQVAMPWADMQNAAGMGMHHGLVATITDSLWGSLWR